MSRWCIALLLGCSAVVAQAEEPAGKIIPAAVDLGRPVDFDKDLVPIFDEKCTACHNVAISESRFNIEDVPSILKGGKRGTAVVAKEPAKSLIYQVAERSGPKELHMPPLPNSVSAEALTPQELGLLRQWILEGAQSSGMKAGPTIAWQSIPSTLHAIYGLDLSPWGRFVACGRANQLDLYDLVVGESIGRLVDPGLAAVELDGQKLYPHGAAHRDFVQAVAFSPTGNLLATGGYRVVKLWERPENVQLSKLALETPAQVFALNADSTLAAVASPDGSIRIVQTSDGAVLKTLTGHTAAVAGLAFLPNQPAQLLSGAMDKTVRLWNVVEGTLVGTLETPAEIISLIASADGNQVYTGHADHLIRGWAIPFGTPKPAEGDTPAEPVKPVWELKGHTGPVTSLALLPPAKTQLVSGSQDGTVRHWEPSQAKELKSFPFEAPVVSVACRPDGQALGAVGANRARLWNLAGPQIVEVKGDFLAARRIVELTEADTVAKSRIALAKAAVDAADKTFTEREESLKKAIETKATAEKTLAEAKTKEEAAKPAVEAATKELADKPDDEALKKKKADAEAALAKETEAVKKAMEALESANRAIAQLEQGKAAAAELQKTEKARFEAETAIGTQATEALKAAQAALPATEKGLSAIAFSPDGQRFATSGEDGVIRLWDAKAGKPLDSLTGQGGAVSQLSFIEAGRLAALSANQQLIVWDANPAWRLAGVLGPNPEAPLDLTSSPFISRVLTLAFSPDGKFLATGGGDPSRSGELILWDVANRTVAKTFPEAHSDTVFSVSFSRDGKWLLSGAADKFVKVFDVAQGTLVRSFEGHTHHVLGVGFKADGSRIASAGADNAIKIWNVETGEQHRTISNYGKQVTAVSYMGVTDNLISGSGDKTVKMHRSNDGANYRGFSGMTDFVYAVVASRDEAIVVAGGEDGVVRVWNGTNGQVLFTFAPPAAPGDRQAAK